MDINTQKAIIAIITKNYCAVPENMGIISCNIFSNQFMAILNSNKYTIEDASQYREDFVDLLKDLCYLRAHDLIKTEHVKEILSYGWENPYFDICEYLIKTKILDVADSSIVKELVIKHLSDNPKIVEQYKSGRTQVAGSIIGKLKKDLGNKFDASEAMKIIIEEIENDNV